MRRSTFAVLLVALIACAAIVGFVTGSRESRKDAAEAALASPTSVPGRPTGPFTVRIQRGSGSIDPFIFPAEPHVIVLDDVVFVHWEVGGDSLRFLPH